MNNNDNLTQSNNVQENNENEMSTKSLTIDYNNLYKLETDDNKQNQMIMTQNDIEFDNNDYIQDESIIRETEKKEKKHNVIFMIIIFIILVTFILIFFPLLFKLKI